MSRACWKLTNEEYEFVKGEVCHIFTEYGVKCIPVSGFEIALKMGIPLIPYSGLTETQRQAALLVSEDGVLGARNGRECIFYNDIGRNYKRQNWTILHELGHIVLDHTGHSDHEEDEANFFAKYAIAPPVLVHKSGAKSALDIYNMFDVSMEEARYAYKCYRSWKRRYDRSKRLTEYERKILALYKKSA